VKKDGYWNYDKSEFAAPSPLLEDDDALEAIWKKEYSLSAIVAPDQFKSYDELDKRLKYVLGQKGPGRAQSVEEEEEYDKYTETPTQESKVMEELEESYRKSKSPSLPKISSSVDEDEDDALSYFQKLAED
jgi:hypothetical protein